MFYKTIQYILIIVFCPWLSKDELLWPSISQEQHIPNYTGKVGNRRRQSIRLTSESGLVEHHLGITMPTPVNDT